MKCVIPGVNVKIFARAIHSLAKVGDELYVEPSGAGVFFRTVNSSRSAFGSFLFKTNFFSTYDFKISDAQLEETFKCKVAMKACLNAFKTLSGVERSVEKCRLVVDPEKDRLIVDMTCKHGIRKTYNLAFIECETLQAVFDKSVCEYGAASHSRLLCDAFINFQTNQEEVTLSASPNKLFIRNYIDDEPDRAKAIHTQLSLDAEEFDRYDVGSSAEVTFCLRELRSLLSFAEPSNLPVALAFSAPGSPIIFSVENSSAFEANFVLATLSTPGAIPSQHTPSRATPRPSDLRVTGSVQISRPNATQHTKFEPRTTPGRQMDNHSGVISFPQAARNGQDEGEGRKRRIEAEEDDVIPGTPPEKRKKFFFKRCFEPTFNADNLTQFRQILAEDSEDEG